MKTKYEYMKPAIQVLFTQHLMEGEPGIHFGSDEIDGDEEGQVLSKEHDYLDDVKLPVQKDIWGDDEEE